MSDARAGLLLPDTVMRPSELGANRLLKSLSAADRAALLPDLEPTSLATWQVIERPNERIPYVYFLTSGLASIVGTTQPEQRIEVGMRSRTSRTVQVGQHAYPVAPGSFAHCGG